MMKQLQWLWLLLLLLFVSACNTTPPPSVGTLATTATAGSQLQVQFLPPIGKPVHGGHFDPSRHLELEIFNVHPDSGVAYGPALGPSFSTANGSIEVKAKQYFAHWRVATTATNPAASEYVRVEIRRQNAPSGPACNTVNGKITGDCLGFFNARLVGNQGRKNGSGTPSGFIVVNRHRTLPIKFYIDKSASGPPPTRIAELWKLSSDNPLDETLGNCPASFDARPQGLQAVGAGLQAVGAIGGLFALPTSSFATSKVKVVTPKAVGGELRSIFVSVGDWGPEGKVAILIVDDFHGFPSGVYQLDPTTLFAHGVDLEALIEEGKLAHGALVFHQVIGLLEGAGYSIQETGNNGNTGEPFVTFEPPGDDDGSILVQAVDTDGLNTDEMPEDIKNSLGYLTSELGYQNIVVNMSFSIVPCTTLGDFTDYTANSKVTFEDYVAALGVADHVAKEFNGELTKLVTAPLGKLAEEPLFKYLACHSSSVESPACDDSGEVSSLVHVAAAGNFGFDFPTYPAALPTVIGVSSQDAVASGDNPQYSADKSSFSDSGEVMAPGEFFELAGPDIPGTTTSTTVTYAGTSFSAPVVSVFTALDLAHETPLCNPGSIADATPPALAHGTFSNTPLATVFGDAGSAIEQFCDP